MIDKLNSIVVAKEEVELVVTEAEKLHAEGGDVDDGGMYLIARLFKHDPDKVSAICFRMAALAKIITKQAAPGWTLGKDKEGGVLTHQALLEAAAVFPLSMIDGDVGFELEGFLAKALELVEAKGTC